MRGNGRGWRWLAAGLALMYVVCAALLGRQAADRLARAREQSDSTAALAAVEARPTLRAEPPEMFGRGEALLEENPDLVGMVGYGERAMYVCRGTDNRWYANHRFDGSEDPAGMIYMDCRCQPWPLGENTILYGHNMRDGGRFGTLNRFESAEWLAANGRVRYATLYEIHEFAPFAVIRLSATPGAADYFPFDRTAFASAADFDAFVGAAKARSQVDLSEVPVAYGQRLLTLTTCSEDGPGGRLAVLCVEREAGA